MFILANSLGRFVMLRCCECGENLFVETDKFKEITEDYVILKDNAKITCNKCGVSQPNNERFIPLEVQIIHNSPQAPDSMLPFWMTRDITTEELLGAISYD